MMLATPWSWVRFPGNAWTGNGDSANHFGLKLLTKVSLVDIKDCVDTRAIQLQLSQFTPMWSYY